MKSRRLSWGEFYLLKKGEDYAPDATETPDGKMLIRTATGKVLEEVEPPVCPYCLTKKYSYVEMMRHLELHKPTLTTTSHVPLDISGEELTGMLKAMRIPTSDSEGELNMPEADQGCRNGVCDYNPAVTPPQLDKAKGKEDE